MALCAIEADSIPTRVHERDTEWRGFRSGWTDLELWMVWRVDDEGSR